MTKFTKPNCLILIQKTILFNWFSLNIKDSTLNRFPKAGKYCAKLGKNLNQFTHMIVQLEFFWCDNWNIIGNIIDFQVKQCLTLLTQDLRQFLLIIQDDSQGHMHLWSPNRYKEQGYSNVLYNYSMNQLQTRTQNLIDSTDGRPTTKICDLYIDPGSKSIYCW